MTRGEFVRAVIEQQKQYELMHNAEDELYHYGRKGMKWGKNIFEQEESNNQAPSGRDRIQEIANLKPKANDNAFDNPYTRASNFIDSKFGKGTAAKVATRYAGKKVGDAANTAGRAIEDGAYEVGRAINFGASTAAGLALEGGKAVGNGLRTGAEIIRDIADENIPSEAERERARKEREKARKQRERTGEEPTLDERITDFTDSITPDKKEREKREREKARKRREETGEEPTFSERVTDIGDYFFPSEQEKKRRKEEQEKKRRKEENQKEREEKRKSIYHTAIKDLVDY